MSIADWISKQLFGSRTSTPDRRQHTRYAVTAGLEVVVDGTASACTIDNVSAGGVRLYPVVDAPVGAIVSVRDPATAMSLHGVILGHEAAGTRLRFESEDAGIIVSTWLRMANETGEGTGDGPADKKGEAT